MSILELEALLQPLGEDAPCGPDLEYDSAFLELQQLLVVRGEQQFGATIIPAEEPDWAAVWDRALSLSGRTRDLRLAVLLMRAGARVHGLKGAAAGLQLIEGLLNQHWDHVHPKPEASDHNNPIMRLNVLADLAGNSAGLADWMAARLTDRKDSLTVRQLMLACGKVAATKDEFVPTEDGARAAIRASVEQSPELSQNMNQGLASLKSIESVLAEHIDSSLRPDLKPLRNVVQVLAKFSGTQSAATNDANGSEDTDAGAGPSPAMNANVNKKAVATSGAINSREDAALALERVCEWLEGNEPSNPAPLLIRRAQRLMSKSFLEIMSDLAPESLKQVNQLAGLDPQ